MASSVAILFAMDTKKIPGSILQEAEKLHQKQAKEQFKNYLNQQCKKFNNIILDNLPSINGLPVSAFLTRMCGYDPLVRHGMSPVVKIIEDEVAKLMDTDPNAEGAEATPKVTNHEKLQAIRTLCRLAASPSDAERMSEWLNQNAASLNEAVAASLSTDCRDLLQELCIGIAFLARQFRFQLYDKLELVIAALVRAMAIALIPWESYVEQFREAKERHNDLELARGRPLVFHHPRMEYQFHEVNHRVLGCIYYTLADLLFSCPSPKLIHFFECRIFRRKEMTRNLLFTILHVVVINLAEIRAEAEQLANLAKQPSSVSVSAGRLLSPLMSRRGKIYSETLWHELPANLYSDIIRVYNDRNRANKVLINEIMAMLRSHAPDKLPLFEEATLKALEMYTGPGAGRLTETYQIGRSTAGRDGTDGTAAGSTTGTGARRRKSTVQQQEGIAGTGATMGFEKSMTIGEGRRRSSKAAPVEVEQGEKNLENQSIEMSSSSSSEVNYSSDSIKQETRISRKTVIVPKIPDLAPVHGHKKRF